MSEFFDRGTEIGGDRLERAGMRLSPATAHARNHRVELPRKRRADQGFSDQLGDATVRKHADGPALAGRLDRLRGSFVRSDLGIERRDRRPAGDVSGHRNATGGERAPDVGRKRDLRAIGGVDLGRAVGLLPLVGDVHAARVEFGGDRSCRLVGFRNRNERAEEVERGCHASVIGENGLESLGVAICANENGPNRRDAYRTRGRTLPVSDLNLVLALVGGLILLLSLGAGLLHRDLRIVSEPMVALAVGVVVGPLGIGLLDPAAWVDPLVLVEHAAELTIALAVTSIALRLPWDYFRTRVRTMATILGPGMVGMWLASAAVVYALLDLSIPVALLVGAIVTPTDPVLANTIVTGPLADEHIPDRVGQFISAESGANDGGAYPFVFLAILLLTSPIEAALSEWVTRILLLEVGGAILAGFAIGALVGRIERRASASTALDHTSVLTVTVALTFATLGIVTLLGGNGILAVFVAGLAYNWFADPSDEADEQQVQEVTNRLFTYPMFVLLGMVLPWSEWVALGWAGVAVVLAILLVRRLPMIFALRQYIDPLDRREATLFAGWFGPIGIAAIFYAALSVQHTGTRTGWVVGTLIVVGSVLAHGASAVPATLAYDRITE